MAEETKLIVIAKIRTAFNTKFGIPRQSGLVKSLKAKIVFEPEYRNEAALRGLETFSHIWLIWGFSAIESKNWSPTVRPPRLGGNTRKGVFATRSPYRPNPLGLSSVKLDGIEFDAENGYVLSVSGADLMDGTPIYDIKPYLPLTDCHSDASDGFASEYKDYLLNVDFPVALAETLPKELYQSLKEVLSQDPRPGYQDDVERIYGFEFYDYEIKFTVNGNVLTVKSIQKRD